MFDTMIRFLLRVYYQLFEVKDVVQLFQSFMPVNALLQYTYNISLFI